MLDSLHLASFKCFEALDLPLGKLTVLSGINGGGKSSVIQSLVLLAQTLDEREWSKSLLLSPARDPCSWWLMPPGPQTCTSRSSSYDSIALRMALPSV